MKTLKHDIWDIWNSGYTICVCTNGFTKKNGSAVMGRGVALEASQRIPKLPFELGLLLKTFGNIPFWFEKYKMVTFPTKHNWFENSNVSLIEQSCKDLKNLKYESKQNLIFLPMPGTGNGKSQTSDVMPILEKQFDGCNNVVIVEKPK